MVDDKLIEEDGLFAIERMTSLRVIDARAILEQGAGIPSDGISTEDGRVGKVLGGLSLIGCRIVVSNWLHQCD